MFDLDLESRADDFRTRVWLPEPVPITLLENVPDLRNLLTALTDEDLVRAFQMNLHKGAVFEELLVDRLERLLLHWFFQWTRCGASAEDLVQDVYLKLWKKNWISTILRSDFSTPGAFANGSRWSAIAASSTGNIVFIRQRHCRLS